MKKFSLTHNPISYLKPSFVWFVVLVIGLQTLMPVVGFCSSHNNIHFESIFSQEHSCHCSHDSSDSHPEEKESHCHNCNLLPPILQTPPKVDFDRNIFPQLVRCLALCDFSPFHFSSHIHSNFTPLQLPSFPLTNLKTVVLLT